MTTIVSADSGHIVPATQPIPGWIGGFWDSNVNFPYPKCDLGALPMRSNMDNLPYVTRQLRALWPEFSWQSVMGDEASRCYRMFAPDISRVGYNDVGQVWAIICPQQGFYSPTLGALNVEVTVTGQRGWVDESAARPASGPVLVDFIAADMTVAPKIWFSPTTRDKPEARILRAILDAAGLPFPVDKAHAINLLTNFPGDPNNPVFPVRSGLYPGIANPDFTDHAKDGAWAVANLAVEIGAVQPIHNAMVDDFNAMVLDIFNYASGNLLQAGNTLTWNVWMDAPTDPSLPISFPDHAQYWRHSIDVGHGSPDGEGRAPRYANGDPFKPIDAILEKEMDLIRAWFKKHCPLIAKMLPDGPPVDWGGPNA